MAFRRIVGRARDEAGNVVGGTGYNVKVYSTYASGILASLKLDSAGVDARTQPFNPNSGWQTLLTATMAPGDTSITVTTTSGCQVGDMFPVVDGLFAVMLTVKTVTDATHLALEAAPGGSHTYAIGATVGDPQQLGHWQAFASDSSDYDATYTNVATGKESSPVPVYSKAAVYSLLDDPLFWAFAS